MMYFAGFLLFYGILALMFFFFELYGGVVKKTSSGMGLFFIFTALPVILHYISELNPLDIVLFPSAIILFSCGLMILLFKPDINYFLHRLFEDATYSFQRLLGLMFLFIGIVLIFSGLSAIGLY